MAGNTRGKLKEQLAGVHNNFTWAQAHLEKSLVLIKEHKPELSKGLSSLHKAIGVLDELAGGIYNKL